MRGRVIAGGLATASLSGCLTCPSDVQGIRQGQTIQTTIVAVETGPDRATLFDLGNLTPPSCGALGDLPPGAVLTSSASLQEPADGCPDGVVISPESLTTAMLSNSTEGSATVTLPGGCVGSIQLGFEWIRYPSSLLDNSTTGGEPNWWLMRWFRPTGDTSACPAAVPAGGCADAFIAKNASP